MKSFLTIVFPLLLSSTAFADSASFKVGKFQGELVLEPADVKVESMIVAARIQHCNFWGTTCAGGPSERQEEKLSFKMDTSTNLLVFNSVKPISLKSIKIGNRFSSCNLQITLLGTNSKNQRVEGYIGIIHENNKDVCESASAINQIISEKFTVPQRIQFWNR
jgi:hypothetical protein